MQQPVAPLSLSPADLSDIKPLHEVAFPWVDVLLVSGVCAAVLALVALTWWRFKATSKSCKPEVRPAQVHWGVVVKDRLNSLPRTAPTAIEESRRVYFELTSVCRELLERILGLPITERTVQEILEMVKGRVPAEDERQIRVFWIRSEALLFAKVPCSPEDYASDLALARDLLNKALSCESDSEERSTVQRTKVSGLDKRVLGEVP